MVSCFLHSEHVQRLVVVILTGGHLDATLHFPSIYEKGIYFVKRTPTKLTSENISEQTLYGDCCQGKLSVRETSACLTS